MRVSRFGNDLVVALPTSIIESLDLREGDEIEVQVSRRGGMPASDRREALERLRALRGRLAANFRFDRDEATRR